MARTQGTSQIGFFGLNGAKIILGMTVLFIVSFVIFRILGAIDNLFLYDELWEDITEIPTPILTFILALIIAGASLLGIIIGEVVERIIVAYWQGVSNTRLTEFRNNIEGYVQSEGDNETLTYESYLGIYVYDLFLTGEIWKDSYFSSHRQELLTRLILILTFLLIECFIMVSRIDLYIFSSDKNIAYLTVIQIIITFVLWLLFLSLRMKTELGGTKRILEKVMYDSILITLCMWLWSLSVILYDRLRQSNHWGFTLFSGVWIIFFIFFIFDRYRKSVGQIWNGIQQKERISSNNLFGEEIGGDQWYNLIICYYELFHHKVEERDGLSNVELYLLMIAGLYTYRMVYRWFLESIGDNITESKDINESAKTNRARVDSDSLDYIRFFHNTAELVERELAQNNFEVATQIYRYLGEQIFGYITIILTSRNEQQKAKDMDSGKIRLVERVMPKYFFIGTSAPRHIKSSTDRVLRELLQERHREKMTIEILIIMIENPRCSPETLRMICEIYYEKENRDETKDILFDEAVKKSSEFLQMMRTFGHDPTFSTIKSKLDQIEM